MTSPSEDLPAGRTGLETRSADSTHKVALATLVDLGLSAVHGLSSELMKTNLDKNFQ